MAEGDSDLFHRIERGFAAIRSVVTQFRGDPRTVVSREESVSRLAGAMIEVEDTWCELNNLLDSHHVGHLADPWRIQMEDLRAVYAEIVPALERSDWFRKARIERFPSEEVIQRHWAAVIVHDPLGPVDVRGRFRGVPFDVDRQHREAREWWRRLVEALQPTDLRGRPPDRGSVIATLSADGDGNWSFGDSEMGVAGRVPGGTALWAILKTLIEGPTGPVALDALIRDVDRLREESTDPQALIASAAIGDHDLDEDRLRLKMPKVRGQSRWRSHGDDSDRDKRSFILSNLRHLRSDRAAAWRRRWIHPSGGRRPMRFEFRSPPAP